VAEVAVSQGWSMDAPYSPPRTQPPGTTLPQSARMRTKLHPRVHPRAPTPTVNPTNPSGRGNLLCEHCGGNNHMIDRCFIKYPHLRPAAPSAQPASSSGVVPPVEKVIAKDNFKGPKKVQFPKNK
jgi:hypothetical protein